MKKMLTIVCFLAVIVLSVANLLIDAHLMWNLGAYVDQAGASPAEVLGGDAAVGMEWLRLLLSPLIILAAAIGIFWTIWKDL